MYAHKKTRRDIGMLMLLQFSLIVSLPLVVVLRFAPVVLRVLVLRLRLLEIADAVFLRFACTYFGAPPVELPPRQQLKTLVSASLHVCGSK